MNFITWFFNSNYNIILTILTLIMSYIISYVPIDIWYISLYSMFWYNFNTRLLVNFKYSNYIVSFTHSVLVLLLIFIYICIFNYITESVNNYSNQIINFCLSYFIYDIIIVIENNYSKIYLYHHLFCIINLLITLYDPSYIHYTFMTILLGEISNPTQNVWKICQKCNLKHEKQIFNIFRYQFIILRFVMFPIYWIYSGLLTNISIINIIYNLNLLLGFLGSIYWGIKIIKY